MLEAGLLEEARSLFPKRHLTALQTVGYQELFDYFDQKTTLEEAVGLIKRNSRRYAKRQMTWFRRDGFWKLFQPSEWEAVRKYTDHAIQHRLTWSQARHEDNLDGKLYQNGTCIAQFERAPRKNQSLTVVDQAPPPPLSWILWHQVRLLALEDETAFLHTALPIDELNWPPALPKSLPSWIQSAIPPTGSTYRIPE
jgi:tRNA dimethylallyltransferase